MNPKATAPISVILADDHPVVRLGLRQMIELDDTLTIVAEAANGKEALAAVRAHAPDVAVLDIDMPEMDGFAVVRALQTERVRPEVVFLTMHSEEELFRAALEIGIKGYVLKESAVTDIAAAIKAVFAGRSFLSPALSSYLVEHGAPTSELKRAVPGLTSLTPMELRVLRLIASDLSSKEIAAQLFVSPRTIETHRQNISTKLDLHGSLALVRFALANRTKL